MGSEPRYVAKPSGSGLWRVWDRKRKSWWDNPFGFFPDDLLLELNGEKRPERLIELSKTNNRPQT
jgi:hypothetical protein